MHPLETTPRQQKFLKIYKETKDKDFAAQEAWPELPPRRRRTAVNHVLTEPRLRQHLEDAGLGITRIMKKHEKALNAKKTVVINGWVEEVDDHDTQLKAVEMGYKLHRVLQPKGEQPSDTNVTITLDPKRLEEVAKRLEVINEKMLGNRGQVIDAETTSR